MTDTLEKQDPRGAAIAAQRKEAQAYKGVSFEPRSNKFTAVIRIRNERRWLGSFDTADDAGAAYAAARLENPVTRSQREGGDESFAHAFDEFLLDEQARDGGKLGYITVGAVFVAPDKQIFEMVRIDFFARGLKGRWVFYCWSSECRMCGARYETKTQGGKRVTGMTRNCAEHRGAKISAPRVQVDPGVFAARLAALGEQLGHRPTREEVNALDEQLVVEARSLV